MNRRSVVLPALFLLTIGLPACEHEGSEFPEARNAARLIAAAAPASSATLCFGRVATVYVRSDGRIVGGALDGQAYSGRLEGTDGDDVIRGTDRDDVIVAGSGNDRVCAGAGSDRVDGGSGNDSALGGDGDDELFGGGGEDNLFGEGGVDRATGGGAFDNCEAEVTTSCEWTAPVHRLLCLTSDYTWDMIPGTGRSIESDPSGPPARLEFISTTTLPVNTLAEFPTAYSGVSRDWLTLTPRGAPVSHPGQPLVNSFQTFASPFAPAHARGERLVAHVEAWAPGAVTLQPCTVRANVLDPRIQSEVGEGVTLAGSLAGDVVGRRVRFNAVGQWSFLGLVYDVEIDYGHGGQGWLTAIASGFNDVFGDGQGVVDLAADPTGLAPGRYVALVTLFSRRYPAIAHAELEVEFVVSTSGAP